MRWQQDPAGNHIARVTFEAAGDTRVTVFDLVVEIAVDIQPVNPFDFFIDDRVRDDALRLPGASSRARISRPYLDTSDPAYACGPLFDAFLAEAPRPAKTGSDSPRRR